MSDMNLQKKIADLRNQMHNLKSTQAMVGQRLRADFPDRKDHEEVTRKLLDWRADEMRKIETELKETEKELEQQQREVPPELLKAFAANPYIAEARKAGGKIEVQAHTPAITTTCTASTTSDTAPVSSSVPAPAAPLFRARCTSKASKTAAVTPPKETKEEKDGKEPVYPTGAITRDDVLSAQPAKWCHQTNRIVPITPQDFAQELKDEDKGRDSAPLD